MTMLKLDSDIINNLKSADVALFDVDDTLYAADCGLHVAIKQNICDHANGMAKKDSSWRNLIDSNYATGVLAAPEVRLAGLDKFFPMIIQKVYRDGGQPGLSAYLRETYSVDYGVLKPDALLAHSMQALRLQGKRVCFYTNGPASGDAENPLHVENVLARLGFSPGEFSAGDIFDLNRARPFGRGKPNVESVLDMLETLKIPPGKRIAFFDDVARNLEPFKDQSVLARNPTITVLCRTYAKPENQAKAHAELTAQERRYVDLVINNLGETLAFIATTATLKLSESRTLSPGIAGLNV